MLNKNIKGIGLDADTQTIAIKAINKDGGFDQVTKLDADGKPC